jgi:hypothetical protein
VKAVGDLDIERSEFFTKGLNEMEEKIPSFDNAEVKFSSETEATAEHVSFPVFKSEPFHNGLSDVWILDEYDIEALAIGAGLLGCGGGGSPYLAKVRTKV